VNPMPEDQLTVNNTPNPIGTDYDLTHIPNVGTVALPKIIPPDMQQSTLGHLYSLWDKATSAVSPAVTALAKSAQSSGADYYFHPEVGLKPVNAHMPAVRTAVAPATSRMPAIATPIDIPAPVDSLSQAVSPATHTVVAAPGVGMVAFPKSVPMSMVENTLSHLYSKLTGVAPVLSDAAQALTEDIKGLAPSGIPDPNSPEYNAAAERMKQGLSPVPSIMEAERERESQEE
jgi:hypothetical protein